MGPPRRATPTSAAATPPALTRIEPGEICRPPHVVVIPHRVGRHFHGGDTDRRTTVSPVAQSSTYRHTGGAPIRAGLRGSTGTGVIFDGPEVGLHAGFRAGGVYHHADLV